MKTHVSLASFPGRTIQDAMAMAATGMREPWIGALSLAQVQLVPQSRSCLTTDVAAQLMRDYPTVQFRLHANAHVGNGPRLLADLSTWKRHARYFAEAASISEQLHAPAYTAHAGRRENATCIEVIENAKAAADLFGCAVGVEGHYPSIGDAWLFSSWAEYRMLFESGVPYALDLCHLNLVAKGSQMLETNLVNEMLNCERCIEVHVSDNDGRRDAHRLLREDKPPWWFASLPYVNTLASMFSEGNHLAALREPFSAH